MVKNLGRFLRMQETRVLSLSGKDLLEQEMATHSSIHTWKIPWTEEPSGANRITKIWTQLCISS